MPFVGLLCALALAATAAPATADEITLGAPTVTAAAVDGAPGTLDLAWDASPDTTSYDVAVGDAHHVVDGTHLLVAGLADNTTYDVSVAAVHGTDVGPAAHVTALTVPAAPPLTVTAGDAAADLSWTAPDGLTGFELDGLPLDASSRSRHVVGLANGIRASFSLVARNAGGASAPAVVSTVPRAPGKLVVLAQPAASVVYGTATVVRAGLRLVGVPVAGERVQLLANAKPVATGTTDASGNVSLAVRLPANATLLVRHADSAVAAADVAARTVKVAPKLTRPSSPASVRVGTVLALRGSLAPARPVGALVHLQRYTSKGWVAAGTGRMTTSTAYSVSWRAAAAGAVLLRVGSPPDATRTTGVSPIWRQVVRLETAADVARDILADRSIVLEDVHSGGPTDSATPLREIREIAAGYAARRSSYGTAPGGSTRVDLRLLKALRRLGQLGSVRVSEIAGGSHAGHSQHYVGKAIDISWVNGRHVARGAAYSWVTSTCRAYGAARVFHPGYDPYGGHGNHIHCDWS